MLETIITEVSFFGLGLLSVTYTIYRTTGEGCGGEGGGGGGGAGRLILFNSSWGKVFWTNKLWGGYSK